VINQTVPFIRFAAVSFFALGLSATFGGILKAAGDNNWILYAQLAGQYLALIPITYLGTVTSLGVVAVFVALIAQTTAMASLTGYRFLSGQWKVVSRSHRPEAADD
jgi:Na+-driven multidrug efflux pump